MRDIKNIMDDAAAAVRPFIIEAYELGRKTGADNTRAALEAFLYHRPVVDDGIAPLPETIGDVFAEAMSPDTRAAPGSVKPAILNAIRETPGLTQDEIQKRTGAKPNSIRGTLWTLQEKEKLIERRGNGFFPVAMPVPVPAYAVGIGNPGAGSAGDV